jgi:hypothetical protein
MSSKRYQAAFAKYYTIVTTQDGAKAAAAALANANELYNNNNFTTEAIATKRSIIYQYSLTAHAAATTASSRAAEAEAAAEAAINNNDHDTLIISEIALNATAVAAYASNLDDIATQIYNAIIAAADISSFNNNITTISNAVNLMLSPAYIQIEEAIAAESQMLQNDNENTFTTFDDESQNNSDVLATAAEIRNLQIGQIRGDVDNVNSNILRYTERIRIIVATAATAAATATAATAATTVRPIDGYDDFDYNTLINNAKAAALLSSQAAAASTQYITDNLINISKITNIITNLNVAINNNSSIDEITATAADKSNIDAASKAIVISAQNTADIANDISLAVIAIKNTLIADNNIKISAQNARKYAIIVNEFCGLPWINTKKAEAAVAVAAVAVAAVAVAVAAAEHIIIDNKTNINNASDALYNIINNTSDTNTFKIAIAAAAVAAAASARSLTRAKIYFNTINSKYLEVTMIKYGVDAAIAAANAAAAITTDPPAVADGPLISNVQQHRNILVAKQAIAVLAGANVSAKQLMATRASTIKDMALQHHTECMNVTVTALSEYNGLIT